MLKFHWSGYISEFEVLQTLGKFTFAGKKESQKKQKQTYNNTQQTRLFVAYAKNAWEWLTFAENVLHSVWVPVADWFASFE